MSIPTPDVVPLTDPARVGNLLAQTVAELETVDEDSLQQACDDAGAMVLGYLMRADLVGLVDWELSILVTVATRVAARIYRNPRDLSSYNYNDVSVAYSDPRILTPDERVMLDRVGFPGFA
jgi:hypothetical protein